MRKRPSSRLLVIDPSGKVLLFRFVYDRGLLEGESFWATPGGALDANETFEQAAIRELREETGVEVSDVGPQAFRREFVLQLPDGERVAADERYFVIAVSDVSVSRDGWTALERETMRDVKWWSVAELEQTADTVWPSDLAMLLQSILSPPMGS
jgi:8-oxo-dGTP pyrophosphatase MutT (NUDIX family)